jgi:hypothetical protein
MKRREFFKTAGVGSASIMTLSTLATYDLSSYVQPFSVQ